MSRTGALIAVLLLRSVSAEAQAHPELLFQAEAQTLSGTCTGQPVRLEGNHNTVTLTDACGSLLLKGVANTVVMGITPAGTIHVEGSGNRVSYAVRGAPPAIQVLGPDNSVLPSSPTKPAASPPAAAHMALEGDDQQRSAECTGQDVTMTGERSAYILRGGCKSLTLRGDLLTVRAEMQPGARIAIDGRGSIVTWTVRGNGRPPTSSVHGAGSRVQRAGP